MEKRTLAIFAVSCNLFLSTSLRTIPSIISFIILIQRKYVLINSAKSLFMRVRSKGFRPDTFKPKKRKWKRGL